MILEGRMRKAGSILFYAALLIELGIVIVDKSAYINSIEGRLFQITFLLCMMKIVMTKYSLKEWLIMAAFFALGAISYLSTDRNEIIRIVAFIAASKNIELRTVMKTTFYVTLAGVAGLIVLSITGIMGWIYLETDFGRGGIEKRYCFGLGHPNALHCMIWALVVLGIYLYWERLKWYHYAIMEVANIGIYMLTLSRTGTIATALSILTALIILLVPSLKEKKWVYLMGGFAVLGCIFFSVVLAKYGYYQGPFTWMDKYVTSRVRWGYFYGNITLWSLFSVPENTNYIDLGYTRLFYWYGYIPGAVYTLVKCIQVFWCYRKKDIMALFVIVMFAVYTVFEAHAISVYMARNYSLLLLAGVWSEVFLVHGELEGYFWQVKKFFQK